MKSSPLTRQPALARGQCVRPTAVPLGLKRCTPARHSLKTRAAAEPQAAPKASSSSSAAPVEYIPDSEFSISKVSFGSILTPVGLGLLGFGFTAYFNILPGGDISSLLLIYGFPISLLGFALSYAQLDPVTCKTTQAALDLRATQMTDNQKQIREDCTRFRYGDEQHLEEALARVFKPGRPGGVAKKLIPVLKGLREVTVDGAYTLVLEFSGPLEFAKWEEFQPKIQSFFGPGVIAKLDKTEAGVDVSLVCDGSGAGRGGAEKKDVLPPLLPGLKARQQ